ncbi:MAG: 50S ribosomal protein L11 [Nanoarchaeota archaeon]|nr:50S ribosomal protein L11 [Nanoarchaeota archaeon]
MKVKLIVEGGNMKPGPAVSQQIGPLGVNLGKIMSDVNSATAGFKGMNVPVEIDVDAKSKTFTVKVFSPGVAELLKKEAGAEKGSGLAHKVKVGNLGIEQIIAVANMKMPNLLAKNLKAAVQLVTGSCVSLGLLVENKEAKEVAKEIAQGIYDKEILSGKDTISDDKKKDLLTFFNDVKTKQEKEAKVAAEAAAAAEAAKVAAATAAPAAGAVAATPGTPAAATAAPAAGAKAATPAAAKAAPAAAKKK